MAPSFRKKDENSCSLVGQGDEFNFGHFQLELSLGYPSGTLSKQLDIGSGAQEGN